MNKASSSPEKNDYYSFSHQKRILLFKNLPSSLKKASIWLLWRGVFNSKKNKWDKLPFYVNGKPRTANNSPEDVSSLVDFKTALKALTENSNMTGLGLAPLNDSSVVAIDLDHTDSDKLSADYGKVFKKITYVEKSPSGRGLRVLMKGKTASRKKEPVEIFGTTGFVTITGWDANGKGLSEFKSEYLEDHFRKAEKAEATTNEKTPSRKIKLALEDYPNDDLDYDQWLSVVMAVHHARQGDSVGKKLALEWSSNSEKHDDRKFEIAWDSFFRRSPDSPQITFGTLAKLAGHAKETPIQETPAPIALPATLDQWKHPSPLPKELWGGYVRKAIVTVMAGPGGSYKSIILLTATVHRAAGIESYLEETVAPGKTLIVLAEDRTEDCLRRLHSISSHYHVPPSKIADKIFFMELSGSGWEELIKLQYGSPVITETGEHIAKEATRLDCDLIIIETANRITADETNPMFRKLVNVLENIGRASGAGVVVTSHVSKAAGRAGTDDHHAARGGGALTDNARSVIVLTLPEEGSGLSDKYRILTHAKSTHSVPSPQRVLEILPLKYCGLPLLSEQSSPKEKKKELAGLQMWDKAVLLFKRSAETLSTDALSARQMRSFLSGSGLSYPFEGALEAAVAKGYLIAEEESGKGGKKRIYRLGKNWHK